MGSKHLLDQMKLLTADASWLRQLGRQLSDSRYQEIRLNRFLFGTPYLTYGHDSFRILKYQHHFLLQHLQWRISQWEFKSLPGLLDFILWRAQILRESIE